MSLSIAHASNVTLRIVLRAVAFLVAAFVAIVSASTAYGLLKMLLAGMSRDASVGLGELSTHTGAIVAFVVLAGLGAYGAKKSVG